MRSPLTVFGLRAPVQQAAFDLISVIVESLAAEEVVLADGDVLAVSSKYTAISEGRVVVLDDVQPSPRALEIAARYAMNPRMVELIVQEADHIFGGIPGFLLTFKDGILSPNAGLDRSNIPSGNVVLFPKHPYESANRLRTALSQHFNADVGIILTDSWLMPGRLGTSGVALACAGFYPVQDERGKPDLFGSPMMVTRRGIADALCVAAQLVMGERDEATPLAVIRNSGVQLGDYELSTADTSITWNEDIYVASLTEGILK